MTVVVGRWEFLSVVLVFKPSFVPQHAVADVSRYVAESLAHRHVDAPYLAVAHGKFFIYYGVGWVIIVVVAIVDEIVHPLVVGFHRQCVTVVDVVIGSD